MDNEVVYLYLDDIIPNRFQPREVFDDQALKELAISIKEHGVIQPIIVRKVENKYEIIAGERRYKASTMAGLTKIPAIVKNLDDKESSKVALIENLQRRDLTPIEEARTYQKILELEPGMTQEQLAATMGKTQSVVSNKLRLLALPDEIQDALLKEKISERHARSLLNLTNKNDQIKMLDKVISERMTVRELDKEIKEMNDNQGQNSSNGNLVNTFNELTNNVNSNVSNNINANNNINDSIIPTPSTDFSTQQSVFNPTTVDINKIRESSIDINAPKTPSVDVKDLMKDTTVNNNSNFKFVPNLNSNINNSDSINNQPSFFNNVSPINSSNNNNSFVSSNYDKGFIANSQLFNNDVNSGLGNSQNNSSNNSTSMINLFKDASLSSKTAEIKTNNINDIPSIPTFNFSSFNNPNKKDVTPVINDIKSTIKSIETKGYKVLVEENDTDNSYQIVIKVDKNI